MTEREVSEKLALILSRKFNVPREKLVPACSLFKDLDADSVAMVELMEEVEQAFNLTMQTAVESRVRTVGDLTKYVMEQCS